MKKITYLASALLAVTVLADAAPDSAQDEKAWQEAIQKFAQARQKREKEASTYVNAILGLGESTYDKRDAETAGIIFNALLEEMKDDSVDGKKEDQIDGQVLEACEIALRKVKNKKAIDFLISKLRDVRLNVRIRFSLCRVIGQQRGEHKAEVMKVLLDTLDEKDPRLLLGAIDGLHEMLRADLSKKVDNLFLEAGSAGAHAAQVLATAGPTVDEQAAPLLKKRCDTMASALEDVAVGFAEREAAENYMTEIRAIADGIKDKDAKENAAKKVADLNDVVAKFLKIYDDLTTVRKSVEPVVNVLLRMMADSKRPWEVRISALQAVRNDRHASHLDSLIETLKGIQAGDGRLRIDVMQALGAILGVKDPRTDDPNWWKSAITERKEGKRPGEGGGTGAVPTEFFGLKTKSTRIVFILDRTGSMDFKCTVEIPPRKEVPPPKRKDVPTGDEKDFKERDKANAAEEAFRRKAAEIKKKWDDRKVEKRMDALKKEFINTIYSLDPRVHFAVVTYEGTPTNWKPALIPATWSNKLACVTDIDKMNAQGGTNIWDALESAFRFVAEPQRPEVIQFDKKGNYVTTICGADTFFLMTDGNHNTGKFAGGNDFDERAFFAEFKKINTIRRVVVNTIILGDTTQSAENQDPIKEKSLTLFKQIAALSGGGFVHLGK